MADEASDTESLLAQYRQMLESARELAAKMGAPAFFDSLTRCDDGIFVHRCNLMGEAVVNMALAQLGRDDALRYMNPREGLRARVFSTTGSGHKDKLVNRGSPYVERLHVLVERGLDLETGQFLFALSRVRNAYAHDIAYFDARILDVVDKAFDEATGVNLLDALLIGLPDVLDCFSFEGSSEERGICGQYTGFRGQHVTRRMAYTAKELILRRGKPQPRFEDDEEEGGIDSEIRTAIIHELRLMVAAFAPALRRPV